MKTESLGNAKTALVLGILVSVGLSLLPHPYYVWFAWPLALLSTLAHEMGHGIAAVFVGGDFLSFKMFADGSGVAQTAGVSSRIGDAIVSAGGLVGPACVGAVLFILGRQAKLARMGLYGLGFICLLSVVVVVRNPFGMAFVAGLGILSLFISRFTSEEVSRFFLLFIGIQLALSVYSRGDYLFTDVAHTGAGVMPSDVAQMSNALFLPYWFWGAACGAFSVFVLLFGMFLFFREEKPGTSL